MVMLDQLMALVLVMLVSSGMAFFVPKSPSSRLFPLSAKSHNNREKDSTTVQHNSNPSSSSSSNNTGGVNYLNDFTFLEEKQDDLKACFHPTVKLLDTSIDGSIVEARRLEFVRIRSMSPRQLRVWKVIDEHDDPVDIRAVFTSATFVDHGRKLTTITEDEVNREVKGTLAGSIDANGMLHFSAKIGAEYFYTAAAGDDSSPTSKQRSTLPHLQNPPEASLPSPIIGRFWIRKNEPLYVIYDDQKTHRASCDQDDLLDNERNFLKKYHHDNNDYYRHYFGYMGPRPKPRLFMLPKHANVSVTSQARYWKDMVTQDSENVKLIVQSVCAEPRIYVIDNFLSSYEADAIIQQAQPLMHPSVIGTTADGGMRLSHVRTSTNAWLKRSSSNVIDTLYERAADVLGISSYEVSTKANAVEDLQVVHYNTGQKYNAHHDWSVHNNNPHSRFATLLIYLSDPTSSQAGGETAFPKAKIPTPKHRWLPSTRYPPNERNYIRNEGDEPEKASMPSFYDRGIKIVPKKGNAVLFYNLLDDGNGDELSLHAALPVKEGEKWLANLWLWD